MTKTNLKLDELEQPLYALLAQKQKHYDNAHSDQA